MRGFPWNAAIRITNIVGPNHRVPAPSQLIQKTYKKRWDRSRSHPLPDVSLWHPFSFSVIVVGCFGFHSIHENSPQTIPTFTLQSISRPWALCITAALLNHALCEGGSQFVQHGVLFSASTRALFHFLVAFLGFRFLGLLYRLIWWSTSTFRARMRAHPSKQVYDLTWCITTTMPCWHPTLYNNLYCTDQRVIEIDLWTEFFPFLY